MDMMGIVDFYTLPEREIGESSDALRLDFGDSSIIVDPLSNFLV